MNYRILKFLNKRGVRKSSLKRSFLHRWTGGRISDPEIWRFSKSSVTKGWVIGCFAACNPFLGGQILLSLPLVFWLRANMFVVLALIFTTNPLTIGPFIYGAHKIGHAILGEADELGVDGEKMAEQLGEQGIFASLKTLAENPSSSILDILLGCLIIAAVAALVGAVLIQLFWKEKPKQAKAVAPVVLPGSKRV